jgi:CBS domain-containing protein
MPGSLHAARTAADVMTPAPRTCSPFSTVLEAVLVFRDADCGAVPVINEGKPIGLVTDRDVALALADHGEALPAIPVSQIMSQGVVSVVPDAPLDEVAEKLGDQGVRRVLVLDANARLVGIIGLADLATHMADRSIGHVVTEVVEHP